jgi:membrane associated rhomboid family serine protease
VTDALVAPARADRAAPDREAHSDQSPGDQLKAALRKLLSTVLERAFGVALDKVEQLSRTLDDIAARGGYKIGAVFGGVRAAAAGRSPVWGAVKGAFSALSPGAKAAIIVVLVLALLLLPVTVVLLLLLLIAVVIVAVVQSRSRG